MNRGDRWLLLLPLALTAIGVVMVYSSSAILGITRYQDPNHFFGRQLVRALLGVEELHARADAVNPGTANRDTPATGMDQNPLDE